MTRFDWLSPASANKCQYRTTNTHNRYDMAANCHLTIVPNQYAKVRFQIARMIPHFKDRSLGIKEYIHQPKICFG